MAIFSFFVTNRHNISLNKVTKKLYHLKITIYQIILKHSNIKKYWYYYCQILMRITIVHRSSGDNVNQTAGVAVTARAYLATCSVVALSLLARVDESYKFRHYCGPHPSMVYEGCIFVTFRVPIFCRQRVVVTIIVIIVVIHTRCVVKHFGMTAAHC